MHLLTQSALLQALGWTLLNSLWQMALVWLAYWLLARLFHQAPSRFRYNLALTLLGFGALGSMITFTETYFFDGSGWNLATGAWGTGLLGIGNHLIATILPWCSTLYLLVLGILLVRYSHQYLHTRRLTRHGLAKLPAEFRVFVGSTGRQMGIRCEVKAWLSTLVDVPMTLGFLKPVILLPAAMIAHLSTQQVEAILVHELAHIRRRDYGVHLLVTVTDLIFFFNPFSRMLIRQAQKEREHCCDDEVLQFRYDPHSYVSALLSLARQHRLGRLALAATGGDDQLLLQRARRILQQKRTDRRPGARPIILLLLTATITVLSLSAPTRVQQAASPVPALSRQQAAIQPRRPIPVQSQLLAAIQPRGPMPVQGVGELVFIPIVNQGAPVAPPTGVTPRPKPKRTCRPKPAADREDDGEKTPMASVASIDATAVFGVFTQPVTLTITGRAVAPRDNTLGQHDSDDDDEEETATDLPPMDNLVFVPNSSWSFKKIDTLRPEDKLAWIEESTEKEIRAQVIRLQNELKAQLTLLHSRQDQARSMANSSEKELKRLLNLQIQIQQEYLKKLEELQNRIRKTRHLTTVYI